MQETNIARDKDNASEKDYARNKETINETKEKVLKETEMTEKDTGK